METWNLNRIPNASGVHWKNSRKLQIDIEIFINAQFKVYLSNNIYQNLIDKYEHRSAWNTNLIASRPEVCSLTKDELVHLP